MWPVSVVVEAFRQREASVTLIAHPGWFLEGTALSEVQHYITFRFHAVFNFSGTET